METERSPRASRRFSFRRALPVWRSIRKGQEAPFASKVHGEDHLCSCIPFEHRNINRRSKANGQKPQPKFPGDYCLPNDHRRGADLSSGAQKTTQAPSTSLYPSRQATAWQCPPEHVIALSATPSIVEQLRGKSALHESGSLLARTKCMYDESSLTLRP
jgi:hypothetical protein